MDAWGSIVGLNAVVVETLLPEMQDQTENCRW
jgi:hypothetical protein